MLLIFLSAISSAPWVYSLAVYKILKNVFLILIHIIIESKNVLNPESPFKTSLTSSQSDLSTALQCSRMAFEVQTLFIVLVNYLLTVLQQRKASYFSPKKCIAVSQVSARISSIVISGQISDQNFISGNFYKTKNCSYTKISAKYSLLVEISQKAT